MEFTQADVDAIDMEIAKIRAVKATTYGDQSTTFRDLKELYAERERIVRAMQGGGSCTRVASVRTGL